MGFETPIGGVRAHHRMETVGSNRGGLANKVILLLPWRIAPIFMKVYLNSKRLRIPFLTAALKELKTLDIYSSDNPPSLPQIFHSTVQNPHTHYVTLSDFALIPAIPKRLRITCT